MSREPVLQSLTALATELRLRGFSISPDQTIGFIEAVGILGPQGIEDVRRAAIALFAIPPDRMAEFDAIFKALYFGLNIAAEADSSDDEVDALEPSGGQHEAEVQDSSESSGIEATDVERLKVRELSLASAENVLLNFERNARDRLPERTSYRWNSAKAGSKIDLRQTLRNAAKNDGEVIDLAFRRRKKRQRRILLLIDVSGSMKEKSSGTLQFAHSLSRVATQVEVFTLGTRLTRVTSSLRFDDSNLALQSVSRLVADFDGGTRIGDALNAYLSVPKYAGFARGAAVVVVSDGLERGDPQAMVDAIQQLSRIAWRISWLTPLANDPEYSTETSALKQVLPHLHELGNSGSIEAMCHHVLQMAKSA